MTLLHRPPLSSSPLITDHNRSRARFGTFIVTILVGEIVFAAIKLQFILTHPLRLLIRDLIAFCRECHQSSGVSFHGEYLGRDVRLRPLSPVGVGLRQNDLLIARIGTLPLRASIRLEYLVDVSLLAVLLRQQLRRIHLPIAHHTPHGIPL